MNGIFWITGGPKKCYLLSDFCRGAAGFFFYFPSSKYHVFTGEATNVCNSIYTFAL